MRAVKNNLPTPSGKLRNQKALARANGTSRGIDCEAIGGQGGVKNACHWVGG